MTRQQAEKIHDAFGPCSSFYECLEIEEIMELDAIDLHIQVDLEKESICHWHLQEVAEKDRQRQCCETGEWIDSGDWTDADVAVGDAKAEEWAKKVVALLQEMGYVDTREK